MRIAAILAPPYLCACNCVRRFFAGFTLIHIIPIVLKRAGLFITFATAFQVAHGQENSLPQKENPFSFEANYVGDAYGNALGGLKTGAGYMGMGNLKMGFDTEKAGWWKGGSFFVNGASIHGKSLTANYLGDLQVASNIDAGTYAYMHELWFRQQLSAFTFTLGLQDLNAEFMATEGGGEFLNSSFGIPSVMAINVPVPIFPLTGLGFSAQWSISERFTWQAAIFDGCQTPFENNPHNLRWGFSEEDGMLVATEFHSKLKIKEKEGTYKVGVYYHSGLSEYNDALQTTSTVFKNNYGFYLMADQNIFESERRKIDLFAQVAVAPKNKNTQNYYIGFGASCFGIFSKEKNDALGFAVAHAGLHEASHKHETALELYYKYQLNDNIALQPDVQYIINPSGTDAKVNNALVGILRIHVNF